MTLALDRELQRLHARAVIAIARADGDIDADEGERLRERIELRSGLDLADLLLDGPLAAEDLVAAISGGPFRSSPVRGDELAKLLVEDGLYVTLGKGHIDEQEAARMWQLVSALGLSIDEFRRLTARWIP